MLKTFNYFIYLTAFIFLTSCSSEDSEPELEFVDFEMTISEVEFTSANIKMTGRYSSENSMILYREKNSNDSYQSIPLEGFYATLTGLEKATSYEVKAEVSNNSTSLDSETYYFTTKAVEIDYEKLLSDDLVGYINNLEMFAHGNKEIVIHAEGLSDYTDVALYLVNEDRTDSLKMTSTIVADSLSFTIPEDFVSQSPREEFKKMYIGLEINDTYQYLLNKHAWINSISGHTVSGDEGLLKLKIFNTKPNIRSLTVVGPYDSGCFNYTKLHFIGEYLGYWDEYYWTPESATINIYDANGELYASLFQDYDNYTTECGKLYLSIVSQQVLDEGLFRYHQRNVATAEIYQMLDGEYTAQLTFNFSDGQLPVESNIFEFTVE
ncbi:hypothetical protein [Maribacter sp. Asnod2-G09]|uniref:hypothetical protein n=1 Tax=Maribacter sp. Asnod2-G09 TaxID=3160577 RepID=UPI00386DCF97